MRRWVSAFADGTLRGFARWYTRLHLEGCPQCRAVLESLLALRERLSALRSHAGEEPDFSSSRRAAMEAAMEEIDQKRL
jgi:hypothetical protein